MKKLIPFFVVVLFLSSFFISILPVTYADGESWLAGWSYRKSHEIANATGAGTNYQVRITVHNGSSSDSGSDVYIDNKTQADFDDIRFTDDDGSTLLDYWLEEKVDSDNAEFWFEVQDDLSSSNQTVYIYYGNDGVSSVSNGDNTFLFFDDFNDASLDSDKWYSDYGKTVTEGTFDGEGSLRLATTGEDGIAVTSKSYNGSESIRLRTRAYMDKNVVSGNWGGYWLRDGHYTPYVYSKGYMYTYYKIPARNYVRLFESSGAGIAQIDIHNGGTFPDASWSNAEIVVYGSQTLADLIYTDISVSDSTFTSGGIGVGKGADSKHYVDWLFVSKYISPEPVHGGWGSEEEVVNPIPVNSSFLITDMDDGDNLYAQIDGGYTLKYNGSDASGWIDIDYILLNFTQVATVRICIKYTNSSDTFSVEVGSTWISIDGSSSSSRSGNWINLTVVFDIKFGASDENDLELVAYIVDSAGGSDSDTMQTDYCDVVSDLAISNFAINDARGNVGASITVSGNANYSSSALYPPDAEFNSVQIWDQDDNVEATDASIVNGFFSVTFSADAAVKNETYNPYIDMVDADYGDAEEGVYVWHVSDWILITNIYANASYLDVGATVTIYATGELGFDSHTVGGGAGDNMTIEGFNMTWDAGNTRWYVEDSEASVTSNTYDTSTGFEATYEISVINQNGKSVTVIWTGIIYRLLATPTQPYNFTATFITLESMYYEQNGVNVTYTDFQVQRNGTNYLDLQKDKYLGDYNETVGTIHNYTISSVTETYGLTGLTQSAPCIVEWVWAAAGGDGAAVLPEILIVGFNETVGGLDVIIDLSFHDDTGLSHYILSHNASGAWVNMTWTALAGTDDTSNENVTLPVANTQFGVIVYCNNTSGDWAALTDVSFDTAALAGAAGGVSGSGLPVGVMIGVGFGLVVFAPLVAAAFLKRRNENNYIQ